MAVTTGMICVSREGSEVVGGFDTCLLLMMCRVDAVGQAVG